MKKILPYRRLLITLCFGLAVFGCLMDLGRAFISSDRIQSQRSITRWQIQDLEDEVRAYRRKHGALPRSLAQLGDLSGSGLGRDEHGRIPDAWFSPYLYEVDGNNFRILSYGRDGRQGGVGLDCDLASDNLYPRAARLTYAEFFTYDRGSQTLIAAFCSGVLVVVVSWCTFGKFSYWFLRLALLLLVTLSVLMCASIVITSTHLFE